MKKRLQDLLKVLERFKFSVVILPENSASAFHAITLKFYRFLLVAGIFSVLMFLLSAFLLISTPVKALFFSERVSLTHGQVEDINKLENKVEYLLREIDKLRETNERMRKAILLGDSSSLNAIPVKPPAGKGGTGGSLITVLRQLWAQFTPQQAPLFISPIIGRVSQKFNPATGHLGIDYAVNPGTAVYAPANGYVVFAGYTVEDGHMLIISHAGDYITVFKHCSSLFRKARERVVQGEVIALSGNSGTLTTGPHLHFEIWKAGVVTDPAAIIIN